MYDEQQRPDAGQHGHLAGFTVGVTAARRADELGALLQRRGAAVLHAPALRIVQLADDSELLAATKDLIDQAPDVVVEKNTTGVRGWGEAAAASTRPGWGGLPPVTAIRSAAGGGLWFRGPLRGLPLPLDGGSSRRGKGDPRTITVTSPAPGR